MYSGVCEKIKIEKKTDDIEFIKITTNSRSHVSSYISEY